MNVNLNAVSSYVSGGVSSPNAGKAVEKQADAAQVDTASASTLSQEQLAQQAVANVKQADSRQKDAASDNKGDKDNKDAGKELLDGKAFFSVDDNDNVVIKLVDSKGKVIKQIPAEEYLKMVKVLDENMKSLMQSKNGKNLFHKEV